MKDLTILYITANKIPENFAEYQRKVLLEAIGDYPLVSISRNPLDFGKNLIDTAGISASNIYRIILRGAKEAETEYIAIAEDDTLYPKEHFDFYRPEKDTFAYNQNRFSLFTWGVPTYSWRNRKTNATLIAPRKLLIEALEERFAKYPSGTAPNISGELGRERIEKSLGITIRKSVEVFSGISVIQINHEMGIDDRAKRHKKTLGPIKAYDIPFWGRANELIEHFKQ